MNNKLPFINEGWYYIIPAFLITLILSIIYLKTNLAAIKGLTIISLVIFALVVNFFRDPQRRIKLDNKNLVVSPADGTITSIDYDFIDNKFRLESSIRISTFMSIFNVHVQRMPVSGTIKFIDYKKGEFLSALKPESNLQNEQNWIGIETENKIKITVVQIAGLIARRITKYVKLNEFVSQGKRIGDIRFGSRVDIYLPVNTKIFVHVGDKVKGNLTVIGKLMGKEP